MGLGLVAWLAEPLHVFGGVGAAGGELDDVVELKLSGWEPVSALLAVGSALVV